MLTQPLPQQLEAVAERLRQPQLPRAEVQRCAAELDALARQLAGALELSTLQRDLSLQASLALKEAGKLALKAHTLAQHQAELLQGRSSWDLEPEPTQPTASELDRYRTDAQGRYAWDRWQAEALAAGLSAELANLGREVMREAAQHAWSEKLQRECGWQDRGQVMLIQALHHGETVAQRWRHLLQTDGERGEIDADGNWQPR